MKNTKRIELKGEKVYIQPPRYDEIKYINKLWGDIATTGEIGGPFFLSEERAKSWFSKMVEPTDGNNFYCLIFNHNDIPIGEVSFHNFNHETKEAELNIKVESIHRGKGYSKEALLLFLDFYFNKFGGETMRDSLLLSNKKGQNMLLSSGFEHDPSQKEVFLVKMTKDRFNNLRSVN